MTTPRISSPSSRAGGFTLIELLIVVAILTLIAAVAMPVYTSHVREARRGEARATLEEAAARMERFFFDSNAYTTDLTQIGYASSPAASLDGRYTLTAAAGPSGSIASSFLLTATAVDAGFDPSCTALTLTSRGQRGFTGSASTLEECW